MGLGRKKDITHITGKHRVHLMKAVTTVNSKGKIKTKLVPTLPSPKKKFATIAAGAQKRNDSHAEESDWEELDPAHYPPEADSVQETQRTKDSHDYMAEWLPKKNLYLDHLVMREAVPDPSSCAYCESGISETWWRCTDCLGSPMYCGDCCRLLHLTHPLHRVERRNHGYFSPSWLWNAGVYISLCPHKQCHPTTQHHPIEEADEEDVVDDIESNWNANEDFSFGASPGKRHINGMKVVVVVHSNGVHHLPFHFCDCLDAPEQEYQLLRMGFYPSTSKDVRTVFTFSMLDDYVLEMLECSTSTHHYYAKLRRLTNYSFPDTVPDRTRELRRVGRQWIRLNELARHGFSHTQRTPEKGSMALFCAACPQPGINLPDRWKDDPEEWKYTRSFVADGNFTCIHRKQREREVEEVHLKQGEGYMVSPSEYSKHLSTAQETTETSTCHEHRAIADKSKVRKGLDVTGIGAIACMRHGAFAPGSVVDFQKGERQINIDYALSEALKLTHTEDIKRVIFAYDINCQYSKRFHERFGKGDFLELREDLAIVFAIGLFHVHGHQESCHARYSLSFVEGAGNNAGEILESLWAVVNELARSTSTMTLAHRLEILDALFGDINWKKMLGVVPYICKNWKRARRELASAKEALALLSDSASTLQKATWQRQLDDANLRRTKDVRAMDILNVKIVKPPTVAKVRTTLMEAEKRLGTGVGVTTWLSVALKIQESQITLKSYIRRLPKDKTDEQKLEIAKRRETLYSQIEHLYETASALFPDADFETLKLDDVPCDTVEVDGDEEQIEEAEDNPYSLSMNEMEDVKLPLPSALSASTTSISITGAREKELKLRIAQADDALENIRTEVGHKSYLYRSNIRLAEGKKQKTRGYAAVKQVNNSLRDHIMVYNQARWAMRRLGCDATTLLRYRAIKPEDIKAVTTIYQPNARGQRNKPLSWIWNLNVLGDSQKSEYLEELYRVNWLRAKSRHDRWKEEFSLLSSEMEWVLNFFTFKQDHWKALSEERVDSPGHSAYALREAEKWSMLYSQAQRAFSKTLKTLQSGGNPSASSSNK